MSHSDDKSANDHSKGYEDTLKALQIELVRTQAWAIAKGKKIVILFEGRDAAGKDGAIKRIVEFLAVRATRVIALPKPSDREKSLWWFQRYVHFLPAAGEMVIFNRSWYNRAGVERVMGFCEPKENEEFLNEAPNFERMLIEADIILIKIWLDISNDEQAKRLEDRRKDPLKQLKVSEMDAVAHAKWKDYSKARNDMLVRTHTALAPWFCVQADDKKTARLNIIQHILHTIGQPDLSSSTDKPDPKIVFRFDPAALDDGRLQP
jgi:polyphosphate kinase 2